MNRCKSKISPVLTGFIALVVMLMGISAFPFLSVHAAETETPNNSDDTPSVLRVEYVKAENSVKNLYDVTVYILGSNELIASIEGGVVRLLDCTLEQRGADGKAPDVFDYVAEPGETKSYPKEDSTQGLKYIKFTFKNVYTTIRENTISFSIHCSIDNFTLSKNFNILGNRSTSSTDIDDDDDEEDTPIAALKPHLIVDSYSFGEAVAGQDVPVTFTLKNTSTSKAIRNVVLTVKAAGDLRIKSSTDTLYIDGISPGATVTKSMKFFLPASAASKVQEIGITSTFEYYDIEGQNAVAGGDTISLAIPADTVERVRIQKVQLPDMMYPGTEEEVSYAVINSGFTTLYNCEIRIVDEEENEYAYAYVGSLEPSKTASETYLPITFAEPGEKKLSFVFSYENDNLQTKQATRELTAMVMEMPQYEEPGIDMPIPDDMMPEEPQGMAKWKIWAIVGGCVLAVIIVTVIVVKAVKKKRSELDDEDI